MRIIKIAILAMITFLFLKFPLGAQTRGTSISSSDFNSGPFASVILPSAGSWNVAAGGTIVGCVQAATPGTVTITDTGSANTFSVVNTVTRGGNVLTMFKAENTTAVASDVLTVHFSSGSASFTGQAATQYSGTATTAYDTGATASQAGAPNITSGSFTPSQALEMVVACGTFGGGGVTAGNITTLPSPTPMSLSVTDPTNVVQMEDGNLFGVPSSLTASMLTGSNGLSALIVATIKSSNTGTPPTLTETFSGQDASILGVPYIYQGQGANVSFTAGNPNGATTLNGIAFSDTLPTSMVVATPNGLTGSCPSGTISAVAGSSTISLSGASLTATTSCTFAVNVTSTGSGQGINTTGQITSTTIGAGIGPTATATLNMFTAPSLTISNIVVQAVDHASLNITYDVASITDSTVGTLSSGSTSVTLSSGVLFHIGNVISIAGAGTSGAAYIGTITGGSAPTFTISPATATTVTTGQVVTHAGQFYCQAQFGTASGVYQYTGGSGPVIAGTCNISIGGLAPSTPFFFAPTVRIIADTTPWTADVCQVGGSCGATEQTPTTLALPAIHPAPPIPPTLWTPTEPNVSGYTVITMQANGSTGNCESATAQTALTHWGGNVNIGDSFQTVVNNIWFDVVIEFPEGLSCNIPATGVHFAGVSMPLYSPSGGPTDWVMIRTHPNAASDFPPFGVRTGPQYASKLAKLVAQTPGMPLAAGNGTQNFFGQILDCSLGCNHFWIENLEMTHATNGTLYPIGIVDPPVFVNPVAFISGDCSFSPNTGCQITNPALTPDHMVVDRVYYHGQPYPAQEYGCFYPGGTNWAIINNYCETYASLPAVYPQANPASASTVITVPFSYYVFNLLSGSPIGMTTAAGFSGTSSTSLTIATGAQTLTTQAGLSWTNGQAIEIQSVPASGPAQNVNLQYWMMGTVTSYSGTTLVINVTALAGSATLANWIIVQPAVVTFSGASTYTGELIAWIGASGLTIDYQTSVVCRRSLQWNPAGMRDSNIPVLSAGIYPFASAPATSMYLFNGHFDGAGNFVLDDSTANRISPSAFPLWRPLGMYIQVGQFGVYDNNYMQAIGQTIYNDAEGPFLDISYTHNYFDFPAKFMQANAAWDGYGYSYRNVIESKQQTRAQYVGNIANGSAAYQNPGNVFYMAGSYGGPYSTGVQDVLISSNVARHLSTGYQGAGGGTTLLDTPTMLRIAIINNLFLDLDRDIYNNDGNGSRGGLSSGPFSTYPMMSDLNFSNNTIGRTRGVGPQLFEFGGASNSGTTVMGEGLLFSNNVALTSLGGGDVLWTIDCGGLYSNFPPNPSVPCSMTAPQPPGTWATYMNGNWIHTGGGAPTPSWVLGRNVLIGAENNRGLPAGTWADLTSAQVNSSIQTLWPSVDTTTLFPGSSGDSLSSHCSGGTATLPNRLTCVGWPQTLNLAGGNPNPYTIVPTVYNPGILGANVTVVNQATGTVQGIVVSPGQTALNFAYVAPDSRACSVDVSPTGAGTWTRLTDSGGSLARTLTFTSLTASTAYDYRLQCYFDQTSTMEFLPGQITSGTISTAAASTRTVLTTFTLPSGATKVIVSFQGLQGSPVSATCTTSPCSVALVPVGFDTRTLEYQNVSSVRVGAVGTVTVKVQ